MSRRHPAPGSDPRALPVAVAERVLARASQLDAERTDAVSIDGLRAAAAEAGISMHAFDAALAEVQQQEGAVEPRGHARSPRRRRARWIGGAAATLLLAFGTLFAARRTPPAVRTVEEAILLRCLAPGDAAELVRPLVQDAASTITVSPADDSRVLTVRTTPAQMERVKALLAEHEATGACVSPRADAPTR